MQVLFVGTAYRFATFTRLICLMFNVTRRIGDPADDSFRLAESKHVQTKQWNFQPMPGPTPLCLSLRNKTADDRENEFFLKKKLLKPNLLFF
jgi:hypothetical protein